MINLNGCCLILTTSLNGCYSNQMMSLSGLVTDSLNGLHPSKSRLNRDRLSMMMNVHYQMMSLIDSLMDRMNGLILICFYCC